jgi:glycosyltransferase involved in cell wall biosynthesis
MAPFMENVKNLPRVIDLIDALSINMQRRYHVDRVPVKWFAYWEWRRLMRYERKICEDYDQVTVVSATDRDAIEGGDNVHINPNGVDLASCARVATKREQNALIFTGNMGYFPNVDAVCYFVREVFPIIKGTIPAVRLYIVGANPSSSVLGLARDPAVEVRGHVPDMVMHLTRAEVAICPMRAGSGMQFKVIEAMAAGTPVVATPFGVGGLEVEHEKNILVGGDSSEFACHVVRLLRDKTLRDYLAGNAIRMVRERYTWESVVASLEEVYEKALCRRSRCDSPLRVQCGN